MKPFMIGPEQGAETPVFLSTAPDPTPFHGAYVIRKALVEPDAAARDRRSGVLTAQTNVTVSRMIRTG